MLVTVVEMATGQQPERVVGTYTRLLSSMYDTFEPFRQLRDGTWYDYALIAGDYTHLQVLDLASGEVIAVEQPAARQIRAAAELIADNPDRYAGKRPEDVARTWGFCPTAFYVPDPTDRTSTFTDPRSHPTGQHGVVSGCVWGDDSSWKLKYVDLSRISEGIVTVDDRFGEYVELPWQLSLREAVSYWPGPDEYTVSVQVTFNRETGHADPDTAEGINFATPDTNQ